MKNYVFVDSQGMVVQAGSARNLPAAPDGLSVYEVPAVPDLSHPVAYMPGGNMVVVKDLSQARRLALIEIDETAGRVRQRFISPGHGIEMSYNEKNLEALAYRQDPSGSFPLLESEVGITAPTLEAVVQVIETNRAVWTAVEAQINQVRLQAKKDVNAASTTAEIETVLGGLLWPSP